MKQALVAFDAVTREGFCSLDDGLDVIEERRKTDAASMKAMGVGAWIDIMRARARTDWASIEKGGRTWHAPWTARFQDYRQWGRGWCVEFRKQDHYSNDADFAKYRALLHAHDLLKAERRCLAVNVGKALRLLRTVKNIPNYDLNSAFEWYIVLVATLRNHLGVPLRGFETVQLTRAVSLPAVAPR